MSATERFTKAPDLLLDDSRLKPSDIAIWLHMRRVAWHTHNECYASVETMCSRIGMTNKTFVAGRDRLVAAGWLKTRGRFNDTKVHIVGISTTASQKGRNSPTDASEKGETPQLSRENLPPNKINKFYITSAVELEIRKVAFGGLPLGESHIEPSVIKRLSRLISYLDSQFPGDKDGVDNWLEMLVEYYALQSDPFSRYDPRAGSISKFVSDTMHYVHGVNIYIAKRSEAKKVIRVDDVSFGGA